MCERKGKACLTCKKNPIRLLDSSFIADMGVSENVKSKCGVNVANAATFTTYEVAPQQ